MKHRIIFVGGIHGVGKSTFCKSMASSINAKHFSASDLIMMAKKSEIAKDKRVENIHMNQSHLVDAININLNDRMLYILDGHFCLIKENGEISKVPEQTYRSISPMALVMLHDKPHKIYARLDKRDNKKYNLEFIRTFQELELNYAVFIANSLDIPYISCNPFTDHNHVHRFISDIIEKEII